MIKRADLCIFHVDIILAYGFNVLVSTHTPQTENIMATISLTVSDKKADVPAPEGYEFDRELYDGDYKQDLVDLVEFHLLNFFGHRNGHNRKPILDTDLFTKANISMCLNMNLGNAIDLVYKGLAPRISSAVLKKAERTGDITDDIKLVRTVLDTLALWKIPKEFAGGFLVIYMELIEGVLVERP